LIFIKCFGWRILPSNWKLNYNNIGTNFINNNSKEEKISKIIRYKWKPWAKSFCNSFLNGVSSYRKVINKSKNISIFALLWFPTSRTFTTIAIVTRVWSKILLFNYTILSNIKKINRIKMCWVYLMQHSWKMSLANNYLISLIYMKNK